MRKWKRVETADGPRFRSALASHEAALLKNLATAMVGLLDERESTPADELEEITGIKTGNAEPPRDPTLRRLLPDFFKSDDGVSADAAESLNGALRSLHEPEIIEAKRIAAQRVLDTVPHDGGRHDGHHAAVHCHPAVAFLQPLHDTVGGRQAVGAAAGEQHRVDVAHGVGRVQQVGLPGSRRAAAAVHRADGAGRGQHDRDAAGPTGAQGRVGVKPVEMADADSSDVGDGTHQAGFPMSTSTRYSCRTVSHW